MFDDASWLLVPGVATVALPTNLALGLPRPEHPASVYTEPCGATRALGCRARLPYADQCSSVTEMQND